MSYAEPAGPTLSVRPGDHHWNRYCLSFFFSKSDDNHNGMLRSGCDEETCKGMYILTTYHSESLGGEEENPSGGLALSVLGNSDQLNYSDMK